MNLVERADWIAQIAIDATPKHGLRLPLAGVNERRVDDCVNQIKTLLQAELNVADLAAYAAAMTYRANASEQLERELSKKIIANWDALTLLQAGSSGSADEASDALKKLDELNNYLISQAVHIGGMIKRKVTASAGGKKGKEKSNQVKAYAIELYKAGKWKNPSQARHALWSQVQSMAVELGTPMTSSQGPDTLYQWLLAYRKSTPSAG